MVNCFFILVKDDDHFCGGTERGLAFLQNEAAWMPYSFIGYLQKPGGMHIRSYVLDAFSLVK